MHNWTRSLTTGQTKPSQPINPITIGRPPNPPNLTPITHQSTLPSLQPLPGLSSLQSSRNPIMPASNTTTQQTQNQNFPPPIQIPQQALQQHATQQNQGTYQFTQPTPWSQQNTALNLTVPSIQQPAINFATNNQTQQQPQQSFALNLQQTQYNQQQPQNLFTLQQQQLIPNQFSQMMPQLPSVSNMIIPQQNNIMPNIFTPQNSLNNQDTLLAKSQMPLQYLMNNTPHPQLEEEFNQLTEKVANIFEPLRKVKLDDTIKIKFQQINAHQVLQELYDLNQTQNQLIQDFTEFANTVGMIEHYYKEGQVAQKIQFDRLRSFISLNDSLQQIGYICNRSKEKFILPDTYYEQIIADFEAEEQALEQPIMDLICQKKARSQTSYELLYEKVKDLRRLIKYQQLLLSRVRAIEERVSNIQSKATFEAKKYTSIDEDMNSLEQLLK